MVHNQAPSPPAHLGQALLGRFPTFKGQLPVSALPYRPALYPTAPRINHCHQVCLPHPVGVLDLREVCVQGLKGVQLPTPKQVDLSPPSGSSSPRWAWARPPASATPGPTHASIAVGACGSLLPPASRQLRLNPTVTVGRMPLYHLEHLCLEFLVLLADLGALLVPVPGRLGHPQGPKRSIQPVVFALLPYQLQSLLQGQLPLKKFFNSAISTSFCPNIRFSSAFLFS